MKLLKKGFTMSELLIAMSIVGVISAMTIPSLVLTAQKSQTGAVLGRSLAQLEVGFQNVIQTANDNSISGNMAETLAIIAPSDLYNEITNDIENAADSVIGRDNIASLFAYLGFGRKYSSDEVGEMLGKNTIRSFSGKAHEGIDSNIRAADVFKFTTTPSTVAIIGYPLEDLYANIFSSSDDIDLGDTSAVVGAVFIDTNGLDQRPNMLGKDIFIFKLRNNGLLVPYGNAEKCLKGNVDDDGLHCAARIVKDGFKVTYY